MNAQANENKNGDLIEVTVKSQNGQFKGTFAKSDTVQTVAVKAATDLAFDQGDRLELVLERDRGTVLSPSLTLESLLEKDHGAEGNALKLKFVLTAIGAGV